MNTPSTDFVRAGSLEELTANGWLISGRIDRYVVHDQNRWRSTMDFPLDRGGVNGAP